MNFNGNSNTNPNIVPFTQLDAHLARYKGSNSNKKRFFSNNMHHKQGALIIGSQHAESALRKTPTASNTPQRNHSRPVSQEGQGLLNPEPSVPQETQTQQRTEQEEAAYWAEYRRVFEESMKKQAIEQVAAQQVADSIRLRAQNKSPITSKPGQINPIASSPASGNTRVHSIEARRIKQQFLLGNFSSPGGIWSQEQSAPQTMMNTASQIELTTQLEEKLKELVPAPEPAQTQEQQEADQPVGPIPPANSQVPSCRVQQVDDILQQEEVQRTFEQQIPQGEKEMAYDVEALKMAGYQPESNAPEQDPDQVYMEQMQAEQPQLKQQFDTKPTTMSQAELAHLHQQHQIAPYTTNIPGFRVIAPYGTIMNNEEQVHTQLIPAKDEHVAQHLISQDSKNQHSSLEQQRYQERMSKASIRQNENYRNNKSRASVLSEKEKYAQQIEAKNSSLAHYSGIGSGTSLSLAGQRSIDGNKIVPLGKYVTQMEMLQPNARNQLKEMLEQQMRDKQQAEINAEPNNNRARMRAMRLVNMGNQRPPLQHGPLLSQNNQLPPLSTITPHHLTSQLRLGNSSTPVLGGQIRRGMGLHTLQNPRVSSISPIRGNANMIIGSPMNKYPAAGSRANRFNDLQTGTPLILQRSSGQYASTGKLPPSYNGYR